jgi:hypothetical protein
MEATVIVYEAMREDHHTWRKAIACHDFVNFLAQMSLLRAPWVPTTIGV